MRERERGGERETEKREIGQERNRYRGEDRGGGDEKKREAIREEENGNEKDWEKEMKRREESDKRGKGK